MFRNCSQLIIFLIVLVCSCTYGQTDSKGEGFNVDYCEGTYYNRNWDEPVGSYIGDIVPNMECAIQLSSMIFSQLLNSEAYVHMTPNYVFYDIEEKVWIVSFWDSTKENNASEAFVGDCISIAIQASDGKVLRIWQEE